MLNRTGNAERDIELWRNGLPRAADLTRHRQPAVVADRPRRRQFGAHRLGEPFGNRQVLLTLDAAANRDDPFGLAEVDRQLRLLKRSLRLVANLHVIDLYVHLRHRCRTAASTHSISAIRADLD